MRIETENAKRYGVFVFHDDDGIVDDYLDNLIKELRKVFTKLLIISNGKMQTHALLRLRSIVDEVYVRDERGFDITVYKEGMERYGYSELDKYDEVVVMNSSVYGPFYPLSEMFATMDQKNLDFWGVTKAHRRPDDPYGTCRYGYIPEHIETYFMAFRKSFFTSEGFKNYLKALPEINNVEEAYGCFDAVFTREFTEKGYQWDVYIDTRDLEGYTYDPLGDYPRLLLEEKKCPFIKRRSFYGDYGEVFSESGGERAVEAFEYIRDNLDYDINLIWKDILRQRNQADFKKRMHLNYVLSSRFPMKTTAPELSAALIVHINDEKSAEYCRRYAASMPKGTDVYITVSSEEKKEQVEKVFRSLDGFRLEIRVIGNNGRDAAAFLVGCKDIIDKYDLVCKLHDQEISQTVSTSGGNFWIYKCFENLLKNEVLVKNVITTFAEHPNLGMLVTPIPSQGSYYSVRGKGEWGESYKATKKLAGELGITVSMESKKEPVVSMGAMFWVRTKALKSLFAHNWQYDEFPKEPIASDATLFQAIEHIYPFCVQNDGYYPAWLMADTYARTEFTNWKFINREVHKAVMKKTGVHSYKEMLEKVRELKAN